MSSDSGTSPDPNGEPESPDQGSSASESASSSSGAPQQPTPRRPDAEGTGPRNPGASSSGPTVRDHPFNCLVDRFPSDNLTVLAHFYRGELSRAIAWRQKMDMTTHWAIITTTAIVGVAFSSPAIHIILPFASLLLYLLLHIEGRRYRFYDVWRTRVRMLEVHFIVPSLAFEHRLPQGNWREQLCNDLFKPSYKISYFESIGRRLHRNYIWLFAITMASWAGKVFIDAKPGEFYKGFGVYGLDASGDPAVLVHPSVVIGLVGAFHLYIVILYAYSIFTRTASGEIRRKDPNRREWPI